MHVDIGHDYALFWASEKWCDAYYVIMEQLHTLHNLLWPSLQIKQLAVKHYIKLMNPGNLLWSAYFVSLEWINSLIGPRSLEILRR